MITVLHYDNGATLWLWC